MVDHDLNIDYADDMHFIKSMYEDGTYWERILDAKLDFLNNGTDPRASDCVRPEIAWSWIISRNKGLQPDQPILGEYVTQDFVEESVERNRKMIDETRQCIRTIESLNMENDYVFELMDTNGLSLIQVGDFKLHQFVGEKYLVSEKNAGTNAHTLSMRYKKPVAVIGPEHYCFALHGLIACSAPIIDQADNAIGALLFTQPISDSFSSSDMKLLVHAMSLISSLASSISAQLRISEYSANLSTVEAMYSQASLEAQLYEGLSRDLIDTFKEGMLVLNENLIIEHASPEAGHIFKVNPDDLTGSPVSALISFDSLEDARVFFGRGERRVVTIGAESYQANVKFTFAADNNEKPSGYILMLKQVRQRTLGAPRKGAGDLALTTFDGILGKSPQITKAKMLAQRFARTGENILITGESGAGKELFAQAIHNEACPSGPFMSINCAAIPPRLIESELFGYEAGSFTGADKAGKPGKIELADGGTLFLDEIGDMPLELQATLLRVIENKRVMRVGGHSYKQISFRLVSATNRNLAELSRSGKFREDLLYRLSVLTVSLPPLREREGDALYFANYFLNECQIKAGGSRARLSDEVAQFFVAYAWPGNVRQLKHAIYSAYYTCENGLITLADLPAYIMPGHAGVLGGCDARGSEGAGAAAGGAGGVAAGDGTLAGGGELAGAAAGAGAGDGTLAGGASGESSREAGLLPTLRLKDLEALAIKEALAQSDGNVQAAADLLGLGKATLYRKLKSAT